MPRTNAVCLRSSLTLLAAAVCGASALALATPPAEPRGGTDGVRERLRERARTPVSESIGLEGIVVRRDIPYIERDGFDARLTSLDLYLPEDADGSPRPIMVFVHGGGWAFGDKSRVQYKPELFVGEGYVFASVNYRLSPEVVHPAHAEDVAAAVGWLVANAETFGGDPGRVCLIGHSAGAHLAALMAADGRYLDRHGIDHADLSAVVLLDGAGYDIHQQMTDRATGSRRRQMFTNAFGAAAEGWKDASPTLFAESEPENSAGLPPLMAIHVGNRVISREESTRIVTAFDRAGAETGLHHAAAKDHGGINQQLGAPGDADTQAVMNFLERVVPGGSTGASSEQAGATGERVKP